MTGNVQRLTELGLSEFVPDPRAAIADAEAQRQAQATTELPQFVDPRAKLFFDVAQVAIVIANTEPIPGKSLPTYGNAIPTVRAGDLGHRRLAYIDMAR